MGSDPFINRTDDIPVIPLTLVSLNLFIFLYVVIFPEYSPYYIFWLVLPILLILLYFSGWIMVAYTVVVFLIAILFLSGIALTFLKLYKQGSFIFLICGLLTLPLGIFGIMASIMVWQHATVPRCIICKSSIKVDHSRPGFFYCTRCGAYYGYAGRRKNL